MSRVRAVWKLYGEFCPSGARSWIWIAVICAVFLSFVGNPVLSANAEETEETELSTETAGTDTSAEGSSGEQGILVSGTDDTSISQSSSEDGVYVTKTLSSNGDGTLQIELENYVTGETYTGTNPADIVLLLDTSSSLNRSNGAGEIRREALKTAARNFIDTIVERNSGLESEDRSRIAIVSYNSSGYLLCGLTDATEDTQSSLKKIINTLSFGGKTYMEKGFQVIQEDIFNEEADESRDRVIICLADGYPNGTDAEGTERTGFVISAANRALVRAQALKSDGVIIYCVSTHDLADADAEELPTYEKMDVDYYFTSEDAENGDYEEVEADLENTAALANRFMFLLSSCNPDALTVDDDGRTRGENGERYYYTAASTSELNEVFQSVAEEVGLDYVGLDSTSMAIDTLTDDFFLTDASQILVYSSDYNGDGTWADRVDITDQVSIAVSDDGKTVTVTGYDYSEHYVSTTAHSGTDSDYGSKLIISFSVTPEATFGGNQLETNGEDSGIYLSGESNPVVAYPVPAVDIELQYEIEVQDLVVYVPDQASLDEMILFADGYVPDGILNAHVNIIYILTDENGITVGTLAVPAGMAAADCSWEWEDSSATICGTYYISCTVNPITRGHYTSLVLEDQAVVHVLHPVLMLQDTEQSMGETADVQPGDYTDESGLADHFVSLSWICDDGFIPGDFGEETADAAPMLGYRLALTEGVESDDGLYIISASGDIPIIVGVFRLSDSVLMQDITAYTEFGHSCILEDCGYDEQTQGVLGIRCLIHVSESGESSVEETQESESGDGDSTEETDTESEDEGGAEETDTESEEEGTEETDTQSGESEEVSASSAETIEISASVVQPVTVAVEMSAEGEETVSEELLTTGEEVAEETETLQIRTAAVTGDNGQWLIWLLLAAGSGAGILGCWRVSRARKRR